MQHLKSITPRFQTILEIVTASNLSTTLKILSTVALLAPKLHVNIYLQGFTVMTTQGYKKFSRALKRVLFVIRKGKKMKVGNLKKKKLIATRKKI